MSVVLLLTARSHLELVGLEQQTTRLRLLLQAWLRLWQVRLQVLLLLLGQRDCQGLRAEKKDGDRILSKQGMICK